MVLVVVADAFVVAADELAAAVDDDVPVVEEDGGGAIGQRPVFAGGRFLFASIAVVFSLLR
eukprot:CAMPEP_0196151394 /NCGR_PEP_ID=MMETSP0910-20130528/33607_1 /TAXON_ID=49265 /ORGANISM="Thalassiosira rotula, Strain GSO102" /LENGTH=60 /DNA_ID=CAMNT_0041414761 /DNA_START=213 /DNA_END=392 /DNA_ORIENTATION=+